MKMRTIALATSLLLAVAALLFWQRASHASSLGEPTSHASESRPAWQPAVAPERASADADSAEQDLAVGQPTREEEQVLVMYDGMADALEQHGKDCAAMGLAVEQLVLAHAGQVRHLVAAQAKLSESHRLAAQQRLEAAAEGRMTRVREKLRAGLATCSEDEHLRGALRKLAELNTPG